MQDKCQTDTEGIGTWRWLSNDTFCHRILLIILLIRRNILVFFCCKVLNTKKTNQHENVEIFLKTDRKRSCQHNIMHYRFVLLSNRKRFRFVIAVIVWCLYLCLCVLCDSFSYFLDNHKIRCKHCKWQTGGHFVMCTVCPKNKNKTKNNPSSTLV